MANALALGVLVVVLAFAGGLLVCLGLANGGLYAVATVVSGPKAETVAQAHLLYGIVAAGAGTALLVAALRVSRPPWRRGKEVGA